VIGDPGPDRWERRHTNGWIATVRRWGKTEYGCSAYPELSFQSPSWAAQGIADLTLAQKIADEHVPTHECTCAPWIVRYR